MRRNICHHSLVLQQQEHGHETELRLQSGLDGSRPRASLRPPRGDSREEPLLPPRDSLAWIRNFSGAAHEQPIASLSPNHWLHNYHRDHGAPLRPLLPMLHLHLHLHHHTTFQWTPPGGGHCSRMHWRRREQPSDLTAHQGRHRDGAPLSYWRQENS